MPVSVATARDPFRCEPPPDLRVPQARVLAAIIPDRPDDRPRDWPLYTRADVARRTGFSALSGTINRALRGIPRTCETGEAHLGLLGLGLAEEVPLDLDGLVEVGYRATPAGLRAYQAHVKNHGPLPPLRSSSDCVNTVESRQRRSAEARARREAKQRGEPPAC